ncbi:hypothetical protein P9112_009157 [Eukaryota sp. TZLM1-RC]
MDLNSTVDDFLARTAPSDHDVTDFSMVTQSLQSTVSIPEVSKALEEGVDLRSFIISLHSSLLSSELQCAEQIASHEEQFHQLNSVISSADASLTSIQNFLDSFTGNIQGLSQEISDLRDVTIETSTELDNKKAAFPVIDELVSNSLIDQNSVTILSNSPINSRFCATLRRLDTKIRFLKSNNHKCTAEALENLSILQSNSVDRARLYAQKSIEKIDKSRLLSIFDLQDTELISLSEVITCVSEVGFDLGSIIDSYVNSILGKYRNLFRKFLIRGNKSIKKFDKNRLLTLVSGFYQYFDSDDVINDVFLTHGRGVLCSQLIDRIQTFSGSELPFFELLLIYADVITSEAAFESIFFGNQFSLVFSRILFELNHLFSELLPNFDNYSEYLLIFIVRIVGLIRHAIFRRFMSFVSNSELVDVNFGLFDIVYSRVIPTLREKFNQSINQLITCNFDPGHVIAEIPSILKSAVYLISFLDSIISNHCLEHNADSSNLDYLRNLLLQLRDSIITFTENRSVFGSNADDPSVQVAILANCSFFIKDYLSINNIDSDIFKYFDNYCSQNVDLFVTRKLSSSFGAMISFVNKCDSGKNFHLNSYRAVASEFSNIWKPELDQIKRKVITLFNSFELSNVILKRIFSKLVVNYQKFSVLNSENCVDLIPVSDVVNYLKTLGE